jgi:hypothetical protein
MGRGTVVFLSQPAFGAFRILILGGTRRMQSLLCGPVFFLQPYCKKKKFVFLRTNATTLQKENMKVNMKENMRKALGMATAALMVLVACKKKEDPDVVKPVIAVNQNKLKVSANAGDTLQISAAYSDDRELGSAKIDIHDAFDGHSHKTASQKFSYNEIRPLSGKSMVVDFKIPVPSNATAGPYHVILKATDKEGNEAAFVEIDLTLFHPEMPALLNFTVNGKDVSDEIEVSASDSLRLDLKGLVKSIAASGLKEVEFSVEQVDDHSHKTAHGDKVVFEKHYELNGETEFGFDFRAAAKYESDHQYALHILLINKEDHRTMHEYPIHFK